ncbi:serine/threonine-protein kinase ULK2-like isoform X2 [Biomphalaria glabrata]|uniref:Serine/threonine-protein kinase ULK2-like isoform X2 n=1 Tax=Biomphalaria glabrata TaxID=6526 RepID=A0A9W2YK15_BIOGL|nr:serine/threonine-protein kinase ULK2-like isoform X2 [Biomphalaria glabrata]
MISETDIGDYEIIKGGVLGTGAFATVWKGRAKKDSSQLVAIKAIKKKNFLKSQQLLSKEITILKELSSLHHRNVVGLLDCVELKDDVCLVMEYCNGGDLADCLHRNGTLSEDTLCSYVKQIAEAMKALQQKGIVHRDLKPQNILLCYDGPRYPHPSEMLLKIADFGFARFIIGAEMATTLCGSPMYMAPEVIMSVKYSAKADLWSIGTILYQCLTGRAPFQAQNPQELKKKYEKSPGLKPNIPTNTSPELRDLLMRMLKRDAEERISFEEFFSHPFLQLPTLKAMSPPVTVPKRRSSSSSDSSTPGKSPGKSPSPSRTKRSPSPAQPVKVASLREAKEEDMVTTLTETAGFTKVEKEEIKARSGRSTPDDFVMVPETLCLESDGEESVHIKKAPLAEEEMASFSGSPQRSPKAIRIQSNNAVTFNKDKENIPTPSSPSRPVTLSMATAVRQSEPITVPSEMKSTSGFYIGDSSSSIKSKAKSPDVRMESDSQEMAVVRRSLENRLSAVDAVDAGSFSPPSVQFCVGTPPNSSGPSWKRSSIVTPPPNLPGSPHRRSSLGELQPMEYHRVSTDSNLLCQQMHNQNMQGLMIAYGGSRERLTSVDADKTRFGSLDRDHSPSFGRRNSGLEMSPPHHVLMAGSPPTVGSNPPPPLRFVPQPLSEETLMDDNHNETLGKLSFVLDLVECILDLARSLGSAFRSIDPGETKKVEQLSPEHYSQYRSSQRSLEQLVLYARSCHLLNSALHMARDEIRNNRLQQSTSLRNVLGEMNTYYHHVVDKCKTIHKEFTQNCKTPLTQKLVMATADKLIYNQAIHMCQTAALDECSKNSSPENVAEVVRRYQVAQILLHSLAQTARNENDKHMLVKYRKSVESRLSILTSDGLYFDRHHQHMSVDNQRYQLQS